MGSVRTPTATGHPNISRSTLPPHAIYIFTCESSGCVRWSSPPSLSHRHCLDNTETVEASQSQRTLDGGHTKHVLTHSRNENNIDYVNNPSWLASRFLTSENTSILSQSAFLNNFKTPTDDRRKNTTTRRSSTSRIIFRISFFFCFLRAAYMSTAARWELR